MKAFLFAALFLGWSLPAHSKVFRNAYVSFELPDRWDCHLEGTEWICNSLLKEASREAIIILTAKEVGPQDTLRQYHIHLMKPLSSPGAGGKPKTSQVKHVRTRKIAGHDWVDAMHLGSEIPSYYTRYLGTVKEKVAILVTFSAHQKSFTRYSSDFFRAIESLRVVASSEAFRSAPLAPVRPGSETLGASGGGPDLSAVDFEEYPDEPKSGGGLGTFLGVLLLIGALGGYFFIRKQKAGRNK